MTFLTINFMPTKYRIMKNKREGFVSSFLCVRGSSLYQTTTVKFPSIQNFHFVPKVYPKFSSLSKFDITIARQQLQATPAATSYELWSYELHCQIFIQLQIAAKNYMRRGVYYEATHKEQKE